MSTWFLEIAGVKRSLDAWGITEAKLKLINQVEDTLSLTARVDLKLPFQTACVLWFDDERRFSGVVTSLPLSGSSRGDRRKYIVSGPWWYLANIIYQQPRWVLVDVSDTSKGYTKVNTSLSTLSMAETGGTIDVSNQVGQVISYAAVRSPIAQGSIRDTDFNIPWETGLDLSCADVLRRCVRWSRDAVAWWNYSFAVPKISLARRPSLTPVTLDLDAGIVVLELTLQPRYDLQPRGVQINFLKTEVNANGQQWISVLQQNAGTVFDGVRSLVMTRRLAGAGTNSEPEPLNLAANFYNSLKVLQWQGALVLNESGGSASYGPGKTINLTHGDDEWATMAALVQSVEEDLFTGECRIEFGPAEQLGIQDFAELQATQSKGGTVGGGGSGQQNGTTGDGQDGGSTGGGGGGGSGGSSGGGGSGGGGTGGDPGGFQMGTMELTVCDPVSGTPQKITVMGRPS